MRDGFKPAVPAMLLALTLAACASQPETGDGAQVADASGQICKRVTATGSNMPQRVCATAAEWDAREQAGRKNYENLRRDAQAGNTNFP